MTSRYTRIERIGHGTFGEVYKVHDTQGRIWAQKVYHSNDVDNGIEHDVIAEICTLKSFKHPNVVSIHEVLLVKNNISIIMPLYEYDLWTFITKRHINKVLLLSFFHQLLKALCYIHAHGVTHTDIKPQNILLSRKGEVVLADFGCAVSMGLRKRSPELMSTVWYRAPELIMGHTISEKIDVWSMGCVFAELYKDKVLFEGDSSEIDQWFEITKQMGCPDAKEEWLDPKKFSKHYPHFKRDIEWLDEPEDKDDPCIVVLRRMLVMDPEKRCTAQEALKVFEKAT